MLPPILDEVEPPRAIPVHNIKFEYKKTPDTQSLLQEFENVYDVFELTHGTLTPPQSPPCSGGPPPPSSSNPPMFTTLEPLLTPYEKQTAVTFIVPEKQQQILPNGLASYQRNNNNIQLEYAPIVTTPQPDIAHELAVVDELVRTRVEDLQWNGNNSNSSSSSSGPSSPSSSNSSNFGDCSSDDPEWMPETIENCFDANDNMLNGNHGIIITKTRKRTKPYSRNTVEDKKSRKKEQNKNAATRYRLKKKAEVEEILMEERHLIDKNNTLGTKITDLQREIKYLKGLMRDLFKAKGLIN